MVPRTWFVKDDGRKLPVHGDYLHPFLSPTSPGTHFRDPPPPGPLSERQLGRVLLQLHQMLHLFRTHGVELEGRTLLDVGTGNGLVPCALLELSPLAEAVGIDPYLDGEHTSSWQPHDHSEALRQVMAFLRQRSGERLDYDSYATHLGFENHSLRPAPIDCPPATGKRYRFVQCGAHDLEATEQRFDLVYCKAIEHIGDWPGVFRSVSAVTEPGGVVYFKHRSFFSYLGPHRYSSLDIPWGHCLLTDSEFRRFVREHHADRAEQIEKFYFEGLANPRHPIGEMVQLARAEGLLPLAIVVEPPRYLTEVHGFVEQVPDFWKIVSDVRPGLSAEELFSGMHHILFRRV